MFTECSKCLRESRIVLKILGKIHCAKCFLEMHIN